jgi:uncharacterized membrane protein YdjX (TVP38/TMEM64 family)
MFTHLLLVNSVIAKKENVFDSCTTLSGIRLSKRHVSLILKISAILIGAALLFYFRQPVSDVLAIIGDRQAVIAYLDQFGVLAPLLMGIILVLQVVVAALPGHALIVGGGYVFGFGRAFCLSLLATVLGSQISFWLARQAGRPLVEKLAPIQLLDKWYDVSAKKGLLFFMFAFMIPLVPADIMNYVAGLSSLSPRRFLVANLIGRTPGVIFMTGLGAYGLKLSLNAWVGIVAAGFVMLGIWRVVFGGKS